MIVKLEGGKENEYRRIRKRRILDRNNMKQHKASINCCLCNHSIVETTNLKQSVVELAQKNKLAEIEIKTYDKKFKQGGYLCNNCSAILSNTENLRKITKTTVIVGNSSAVILPRQWLNKEVIVYLLEK